MTFHLKAARAMLAATALIALPTAVSAHEVPAGENHVAHDDVSSKANEVEASAEQLQREANALGASVAEADAADVNRFDDDDDDDGDDKWGLLGLLGLAGLLGLKRRDDIDDDVRRRTTTTGTTDRDTRL
jgi:MYXO-CTERM domain-containing protein